MFAWYEGNYTAKIALLIVLVRMSNNVDCVHQFCEKSPFCRKTWYFGPGKLCFVVSRKILDNSIGKTVRMLRLWFWLLLFPSLLQNWSVCCVAALSAEVWADLPVKADTLGEGWGTDTNDAQRSSPTQLDVRRKKFRVQTPGYYTDLKNPPPKNPHFYFNLILVYTWYATNNAIFCFWSFYPILVYTLYSTNNAIFYCFKAFKALSYSVFVLFYLFFPACPKKPKKPTGLGFFKKNPGFLNHEKITVLPVVICP